MHVTSHEQRHGRTSSQLCRSRWPSFRLTGIAHSNAAAGDRLHRRGWSSGCLVAAAAQPVSANDWLVGRCSFYVDKDAFAALLMRAVWLTVALVSGRYDYAVARRALAAQEASMSFAKDIQMTADETVVDNFLDFLVSSETERLNNLGLFPPALYFTKVLPISLDELRSMLVFA